MTITVTRSLNVQKALGSQNAVVADTLQSLSATTIDDFMILDIDEAIAAQFSQNIEQPHRHEFQEIIWVKQGGAEHLLDDETVRVLDHSLHIVPKGRIHRGILSGKLRACCLRFNDEFLQDASYTLFSQFSDISAIPLSPEDSEIIETYFYLLARESAHMASHNRTTLIYLLRALISKVEALRPRLIGKRSLSPTRYRCLWESFNILIEREFRNLHKVEDVARRLGVSSRKLNEMTRVFTGMTTSQLIDMRLITEAKRLMRFNGMPGKEVAFELGFNEHSYFSKVFKKLTGQTPSEFIKDHTPYLKFPVVDQYLLPPVPEIL